MSALAAHEGEVNQYWHTAVEAAQKEDEHWQGLSIKMCRYWSHSVQSHEFWLGTQGCVVVDVVECCRAWDEQPEMMGQAVCS